MIKKIITKCLSPTKNPLFWISLCYWIVSALVFKKHGITYFYDFSKYSEYAYNLNHGFYFEPHYFWYITYVFIIHGLSYFTESYTVIIAFQYVLSFVSILAIYQTSLLLFEHKKAAIVAAIISILFIDGIYWNSCLLAESVYLSLTCISFYLVIRWHQGKLKLRYLPFVLLVIIFTGLAKPTGIALIASLIICFALKLFKYLKYKSLKWVLGIGSILMIILIANRMLNTFIIIEENYSKGEIIFEISSTRFINEYPELVVLPPSDLAIPDSNYTPLARIGLFIFENPIYWLELFGKKVFYFLIHIRPYWSTAHNIYSLIFLIPAYLLSFFTLTKTQLSRSIILFIILYLLFHTLIIGVTVVDWDGRFILPLLPVIFILSSRGLFYLKTPIQSLKNHFLKNS